MHVKHSNLDESNLYCCIKPCKNKAVSERHTNFIKASQLLYSFVSLHGQILIHVGRVLGLKFLDLVCVTRLREELSLARVKFFAS